MTPEHLRERLAKMPKFVRDEVARLEADVATLERQLKDQEAVKSNVLITSGLSKRGLPQDSHVLFVLGEYGEEVTVRHEKSEPGTLNLHGSSRLILYPSSSNVVHLRIDHPFFKRKAKT